MSLIDSILSRRRERATTGAAQYNALLRKAVADKLAEPEVKQFEELARELGKSAEAIEGDLSVMRRHRAFTDTATTFRFACKAKATANQAANVAIAAVRDEVARHEAAMKQLKAAEAIALNNLAAADKATEKALRGKRGEAAIEHVHYRLFNHAEPPPLKIPNTDGEMVETPSLLERERSLRLIGEFHGPAGTNEVSNNFGIPKSRELTEQGAI